MLSSRTARWRSVISASVTSARGALSWAEISDGDQPTTLPFVVAAASCWRPLTLTEYAFRSPLQGLGNVILTPHVGGSTSEAQAAIGREVAIALTRFVNAGATATAVNFPQIDHPVARGAHRILNVHRNVPGVLRDINRIVSDLSANIQSQVLSTDASIGYLVMDMDRDVSDEVCRQIAALETNIRTRILY